MGHCSMCGPSIPAAENNIPLQHNTSTSKLPEMIDRDIDPFLGLRKSPTVLYWPSQQEGITMAGVVVAAQQQ